MRVDLSALIIDEIRNGSLKEGPLIVKAPMSDHSVGSYVTILMYVVSSDTRVPIEKSHLWFYCSLLLFVCYI